MATLVVAALPFLACEEEFSGGGGGLPGDSPRAVEAGAALSDSAQERKDSPGEAAIEDARVVDVTGDTNAGD